MSHELPTRRRLFKEMLQGLPDRQREVYVQVVFYGRSEEEVAEEHGAKPSTIRKYLRGATNYVRDHVEDEVGVSPEGLHTVLNDIRAGRGVPPMDDQGQ